MKQKLSKLIQILILQVSHGAMFEARRIDFSPQPLYVLQKL